MHRSDQDCQRKKEFVYEYGISRKATATRPVKLLKGFQRIRLQLGETRTVVFPVGREQLEYLDASMQRVVEPGEFELMVGGSSQKVEKIVLVVK